MNFTPADAHVLERILTWRRDVREFRPDPIDEATIATLRSAMALAPSVGNSRPWRVIRVADAALRAAVCAEFEACNTAAAATYAGERATQYRQLILAGLATAPLQLAVFTATDPEAGHRLGRLTMPETLMQSSVMAIHTLWLAARARNLGLGMVSILDPARIEALFATPPDWRFTAWLCIGHPVAEDDMPLLHRKGWQENTDAPWSVR